MKKTFCDFCGNEVTTGNDGWHLEAKRKGNNGSIEVTVECNDYAKDYCKYCVIDTINTLDDRAR